MDFSVLTSKIFWDVCHFLKWDSTTDVFLGVFQKNCDSYVSEQSSEYTFHSRLFPPFSLLLWSNPTPWNLKAIIQTCSVKKAFLEISQNSQVLSCEFCEFSKNTFFDRTHLVATSRNHWNPIEINSFYDLTCTKWKRSRKNLGYYLGQK